MTTPVDVESGETLGFDPSLSHLKDPLDVALEKNDQKRLHELALTQLKLVTDFALKAAEINEERLDNYEFGVKA